MAKLSILDGRALDGAIVTNPAQFETGGNLDPTNVFNHRPRKAALMTGVTRISGGKPAQMQVDLDGGSGQTIRAVAILYAFSMPEAATIRIRLFDGLNQSGNVIDTYGGALDLKEFWMTQGDVLVLNTLREWNFHHHVAVFPVAHNGVRSMEILVDDPSDGWDGQPDDVFQFSRLMAGPLYEFPLNPEPGFAPASHDEEVERIETETGTLIPVAKRPRTVMQASLNFVNRDDYYSRVNEITRLVGTSRDVLMIEDYEDKWIQPSLVHGFISEPLSPSIPQEGDDLYRVNIAVEGVG